MTGGFSLIRISSAPPKLFEGPVSALYGSGALGGIIAFRTLDAADVVGEEGGLAIAARGGYQGVNGEINTGASVFLNAFDGRFDAVGGYSYRNSGDIDLGDGSTLASDDEVISGLVKSSFRFNDAARISATWVAFRNSAIEPNNPQELNEPDPDNPLTDKKTASDTIRLGFEYAPADNQWIDLKTVAYRNFAEVNEDEINSSRIVTREVTSYGAIAENRSRFALGSNANIALTIGGEYYDDDQVGADNTTADGTRGGIPNASSQTYGFFAQAELILDGPFGALRLIPAIRYDRFQNDAVGEPSTSDNAASPKIGLSWAPRNWLLLFGSYAEAFRAPSFNEIYNNGVHFEVPLGPVSAPNFFISNTNLQSERSRSFEVGAGLDFENLLATGDQLKIKGSYFDAEVENLIDLQINFMLAPSCFVPMIPGPCTAGTTQAVNTANAELSGGEIEASYDSDHFYVRAAFSTIDGRDATNGDYVGILTPDRFNFNAGVKLANAQWRIGAHAEIATRFDKVNSPADARGAYETVDLYAVWSPSGGPIEGLRVDFGIDNIFDENYERVFAGVPEPGRNVKAVLRWNKAY